MSNRFSEEWSHAKPQLADLLVETADRNWSSLETTVEPARETDVPHAIYMPDTYEPNYAYPLIVWFHDEGGSELDMLQLLPDISTRNYFGVSLRGPCSAETPVGGGYRWSDRADDLFALEQQVFETVVQLRRTYHLHSERIFVGGLGTGATVALQLGLRRPEWFAGVATIAGELSEESTSLSRFRDLQGMRVLIGHENEMLPARRDDTVRTGRLLHCAGLTVCMRAYEGAHEITAPMANDLNRWMMQEMYRPAMV